MERVALRHRLSLKKGDTAGAGDLRAISWAHMNEISNLVWTPSTSIFESLCMIREKGEVIFGMFGSTGFFIRVRRPVIIPFLPHPAALLAMLGRSIVEGKGIAEFLKDDGSSL
jgi:hypothetical protein